MSDKLFDVVFFGILQAGKEKEAVMQNMASLFKTDARKLAPYFAGGRKVIKGKLSAGAAEKYKNALENVGLTITLELCEITTKDTTETATANSSTARQTQASDNNEAQNKSAAVNLDTSGITLAEVGADVVENPAVIEAQKIEDIDDISMAEVGTDVIENPVAVTPQKIADTSDISMADVGTNVLDHPTEVIPQKIEDISGISLADAGEDLITDPKPVKKADIPDISELSLDD